MTLLEVLVVVAVLVPVILAAATGLLVTVKLSVLTKDTQDLEAAATAYAESLKQAGYVECAEPGDYRDDASLWSPDPQHPMVVDVVAIRYWSQSANDYVDSCTGDGGTQLITVSASIPERQSELDVVKRDPDASASTGATP